MRKKFYKLFYFVHVVGYISIFAGCIYHERTLRPVSDLVSKDFSPFELKRVWNPFGIVLVHFFGSLPSSTIQRVASPQMGKTKRDVDATTGKNYPN